MAATLCLAMPAAQAASFVGSSAAGPDPSGSEFCSAQPNLSAQEKDRLFQFSAFIQAELKASGARLALISRSGLDLGRFGHRYSHAGLSLQHNPASPWAVRQLYYACDEGQPRIFDQGLAAFVLGTANASLGFVSVVLLPEPAQQLLEQQALRPQAALQLLGSRYSANAYAFAERYQNCNQWVAELMAMAWGGPPNTRQAAQQWLQQSGYQPSVFEVGLPLWWLSSWIPWVHHDDHPEADLRLRRFQVSMPVSLEAFVRLQWPQAERLQFCHNAQHMLVRRSWEDLEKDCLPEPQDQLNRLVQTSTH